MLRNDFLLVLNQCRILKVLNALFERWNVDARKTGTNGPPYERLSRRYESRQQPFPPVPGSWKTRRPFCNSQLSELISRLQST